MNTAEQNNLKTQASSMSASVRHWRSIVPCNLYRRLWLMVVGASIILTGCATAPAQSAPSTLTPTALITPSQLCGKMEACVVQMKGTVTDFRPACLAMMKRTDDGRNAAFDADCTGLKPCGYLTCVVSHISIRGASEKIQLDKLMEQQSQQSQQQL